MALGVRVPLLKKVNTTRLNSSSRTSFLYCGPRVEEIPLDYLSVLKFPSYRRKYLLFDIGKSMLGIPTMPEKIDGLTTVRVKPVEEPLPWPIDKNHGLDLRLATVSDMKKPIDIEDIVKLESLRLGLTYGPKRPIKKNQNEGQNKEGKSSDENGNLNPNTNHEEDDKQQKNTEINAEGPSATVIDLDMALFPGTILPNQVAVSEIFAQKL